MSESNWTNPVNYLQSNMSSIFFLYSRNHGIEVFRKITFDKTANHASATKSWIQKLLSLYIAISVLITFYSEINTLLLSDLRNAAIYFSLQYL